MKKSDLLALMLMFAGLVILILRPETPKRESVGLALSPIEEGECPYCAWKSTAEGVTNRRRSLSAHVRQQHPRQWTHTHSYSRRLTE